MIKFKLKFCDNIKLLCFYKKSFDVLCNKKAFKHSEKSSCSILALKSFNFCITTSYLKYKTHPLLMFFYLFLFFFMPIEHKFNIDTSRHVYLIQFHKLMMLQKIHEMIEKCQPLQLLIKPGFS